MKADRLIGRVGAAAALIVLACASMVPVLGAGEDAVERTRLERMLADGDNGMIVQVFRRHPGKTLPFIDHYFEGGLAMIEKGQEASAAEKALTSFRTGIRFAKLADEAFGSDMFSSYANSFASWSPSEQKSFREGQRLFKQGIKEKDAAKARQCLEMSLKLAQSLGDLWGRAMAYNALAENALQTGEFSEARRLALLAVGANRELHLQEDAVQAARLVAMASSKIEGDSTGVAYLGLAWNMIDEGAEIEPAVLKEMANEYVAALEAIGRKAEAAQFRKTHPIATDAAPTTSPASTPPH